MGGNELMFAIKRMQLMQPQLREPTHVLKIPF